MRIGGGPTVVGDFLAADLIDTLHVVHVPILRGGGVRLWVGVEGIEERYDVAAVSSPSRVTHLTFSVDGRSPDVRRGCSRPARSGRGMRDAPFFAPPTPPAP